MTAGDPNHVQVSRNVCLLTILHVAQEIKIPARLIPDLAVPARPTV
jgi:hypothetical protein